MTAQSTPARTMPDPRGRTYEDLFGRKTGKHTHPDTHPAWMTFADGTCRVCAAHYQPARSQS